MDHDLVRNVLTRLTALGILHAALAIVLALLASRIAAWLAQAIARIHPVHRALALGLVPLARILIWAGASAWIVLTVLAPEDNTRLALVAALLVALAVAGQDELRNLVGGIVVLLRKPFRVGDIISSDGVYGEVVAIHPTCTVVKDFEHSVITLPNGRWLVQPVISNNLGELDALVACEVPLPFDRDPAAVRDLCRRAAMASPLVRLDRPITVSMKIQSDHRIAMILTIKAYVYDVRLEPRMRTDVLSRALSELKAAGHIPRLAEYEL
ncbi:Miniconductance mechanosensitive channel MscM precursor [Azoarcus sp. Aa7]|nr:Miniconductance mechanosensitive channel MscM precursor [Azoarcus sp. Aa7]